MPDPTEDSPRMGRVAHVGATAEFQRERPADIDHPHLVGVVLAEHRHRTHCLGLVQGGDEGVHLIVGLDGLVCDLFDLGALVVGERALPVEIEPQVTGTVQRTGLNRGGAQYLSQRGVHHVGARVALGGAVAPLGIHRGRDGVALDELSGLDVDPVCPQGFGDLLYIGHSGLGGD